MFTRRKMILFLILLAILIMSSSKLSSRSTNTLAIAQQDKAEKIEEPIVNYVIAETVDAARQAKSNWYNKRGGGAIRELPPDEAELPVNVHWWQGLEALPSSQSNAILIGDVTNRQAYLSGDKTGVYSEFTIRVERVLKADPPASCASGDTLITERQGGAVRFPSGKIQRYRISKQGMPEDGKRYLFFLKQNDDGRDFSILTAYELRDGRVFPLDGRDEEKHPHSVLQFAKYEGVEESGFLSVVQEEIKRSPGGLSGKGAQRQ